MTKTKKLTLSAVLTATAFVLVVVSKYLPAPWLQGGSVTLGSMVPIILVSVMVGTKWGLASGLVFAIIQMMTGLYLPPTKTAISLLAVVFLDYIAAFTVLGLANVFVKLLGNKPWAIPLSGTIVTCLRYLMHVLSGILIWGAFVETDSVPIYALVYNGTYMAPEIIITTVVLAIITPKIKKRVNV